MRPIVIKSHNIVLGRNQEGVKPLYARVENYKESPCVKSAWEPSPDELKMLQAGGSVVLSVLSYPPPPVWIDVQPPFKDAPPPLLDDCPLCKNAGRKQMASRERLNELRKMLRSAHVVKDEETEETITNAIELWFMPILKTWLDK